MSPSEAPENLVIDDYYAISVEDRCFKHTEVSSSFVSFKKAKDV